MTNPRDICRRNTVRHTRMQKDSIYHTCDYTTSLDRCASSYLDACTTNARVAIISEPSIHVACLPALKGCSKVPPEICRSQTHPPRRPSKCNARVYLTRSIVGLCHCRGLSCLSSRFTPAVSGIYSVDRCSQRRRSRRPGGCGTFSGVRVSKHLD